MKVTVRHRQRDLTKLDETACFKIGRDEEIIGQGYALTRDRRIDGEVRFEEIASSFKSGIRDARPGEPAPPGAAAIFIMQKRIGFELGGRSRTGSRHPSSRFQIRYPSREPKMLHRSTSSRYDMTPGQPGKLRGVGSR